MAKKEHLKEYASKNVVVRRSYCNKRYASMKSATPKWVNLKIIEDIYILAQILTRSTGINYEVDHVYPIQGKTCCGLHVPWNLRVVTKSYNNYKKTKIIDKGEDYSWLI